MSILNRNIATVVAKLNARASYAPIAMAILFAIPILLLGCPEETPAPANMKYVYVCENGTVTAGNAPSAGVTSCAACDGGYRLDEAACVANAYRCENGAPVTAVTPDGVNGENRCGSCEAGFAVDSAFACAVDTDGDNVADAEDNCLDVPNANDQAGDVGKACDTDIDDDGDGLIEIWTLEQLHNMRFALDGTIYKKSDTALGDTTGAPTTETTNCKTATGGVYLCGYELAQSLDFDKDKDGRTWDATTLALDVEDNDDLYFDVDAGGWLPVGTSPGFSAIFEGNGHTIANLAIRSDENSIGLFGATTGARIRNVGLTTFLVVSTGSTAGEVGGLVGRLAAGSSVIASYAAGVANGGDNDADVVGGLVGVQHFSDIIASYAAGVANGGDGNVDAVGGLVGVQGGNGGITIASYATGVVNGGDGDSDRVGGLVGTQEGRPNSIIASYATGAVNGGDGDNDRVGGLVGFHDLGTGNVNATASYATGAVNGGPGTGDRVGSLVGFLDLQGVTDSGQSYPASYGFGAVSGKEMDGVSPVPTGVTSAAALTLTNATSVWNAADSQTLGAWDFGTAAQSPRLRYADYDGTAGTDYTCDMFLAMTCDTPLPGQGQ